MLVRSRESGGTLAGELGGYVTVDGLGARIGGDLVVLAVPYSAVSEAISALGDLDGKILVDSTNPINADFTGLVTAPGTSGAEAIAAVAPGATVVKAFNSVFAGNILAGGKNGQPLDLLIAGDDAEAKAAVTAFGEKTGFRVIDTGSPVAVRHAGGSGLPAHATAVHARDQLRLGHRHYRLRPLR